MRAGARAALAVAAVVLAGCGGHPVRTSTGTTTSTSNDAVPGGSTATSGPGASTSTIRGAAGGSPTSTAAAGATNQRAASGAGPAPVTPGTYRYRQSGSFTAGTQTGQVPPEGTLVVDQARPDGTQVSHRYQNPNQAPSDTTLLFRPDGIFIASQVERSSSGGQTVAFTCTFSPPLPTPPWPPKVGQTFAGTGNCGSFTVQVNGKLTGTRQVTLDGAPVQTYVIDTTIVTHGSLNSTVNQEDWFAPSLRLSTHVQTHSQGSYGPFQFSGQLTADLESARPS